jgi:hypothetical protein
MPPFIINGLVKFYGKDVVKSRLFSKLNENCSFEIIVV